VSLNRRSIFLYVQRVFWMTVPALHQRRTKTNQNNRKKKKYAERFYLLRCHENVELTANSLSANPEAVFTGCIKSTLNSVSAILWHKTFCANENVNLDNQKKIIFLYKRSCLHTYISMLWTLTLSLSPASAFWWAQYGGFIGPWWTLGNVVFS